MFKKLLAVKVLTTSRLKLSTLTYNYANEFIKYKILQHCKTLLIQLFAWVSLNELTLFTLAYKTLFEGTKYSL